MSDIKDLLEQTAQAAGARPSAETVEADVRRGRAAVAQRRRGQMIASSVAGTLVVAAIAGATILMGDLGRSAEPAPTTGVHQKARPDQSAGIRLVAYTGEQLDGFFVEQVPAGWYLQGSNPYSLTIAPEGDTSHPDAFTGKLVIMLLSSSAPQELPEGEPVKVGEHEGVVDHQPEADILTYEDSEGHLVQIQAWRSALGWSNQQLVRFADAVTVTSDAKAGVG